MAPPTAHTDSTPQCSMPSCDRPQRYGQRYCRECHSKYMKAWRAKRRRDLARLQASVVQMRSTIVARDREIQELKVG